MMSEAENIMNAELGKISTWARENKLQFNEQKSQVMLLTRRRRKENKEIKIYLKNRPLIQVNSMRYLGIIFDYKLTFKEHINYMSEKCDCVCVIVCGGGVGGWVGVGGTILCVFHPPIPFNCFFPLLFKVNTT